MMKKLIVIILLIGVISFAPTNTLAHPGRTDQDGCHTCRTNCPKWGLEYGEYHCHVAKNHPAAENNDDYYLKLFGGIFVCGIILSLIVTGRKK